MSNTFQRYLTEAEEKQLFSTLAKLGDHLARRDHAWMRFLRFSGVRIKQFSLLNVGDAKEIIRSHYMQLKAVKGGRAGTTYIRRKARNALGDLLKVRRAMGYTDDSDAPLVMSRKHGRMSVRTYQSRTRHWCAMAGLDVKVSPHWFRHTYAKRFIKTTTAEGAKGLLILNKQLNQSSMTSTLVYTQPDREEIEDAIEEAG